MAWPDDQAYREAVQNPQSCFADPELRAGRTVSDRAGLPRVMSGNFASVYKIDCANRSWAIRCFRKEIADQAERYAAIQAHLHQSKLPYIVGFDFLPQGIRVSGRWYPILKMEWIAGETLDSYVDLRVNDAKALIRLAREWHTMVMALHEAEIAHGDLQHGNVLVVNGALKLIDYDGMYVPSLRGKPSNERGHPSYQHPNRSDSDFGPRLDLVSAWVIFGSLLGLSVAPYLWEMLGAGDDRLLFSSADFKDPDNSQALWALRATDSPRLKQLAEEMERIFRSPQSARPLDALFVPRDAQSSIGGLPSWMQQHAEVPLTAADELSDSSSLPDASPGPDWLFDHVETTPVPRPPVFSGPMIMERATVGLAVSGTILALVAFVLGAVPPLLISGVVGSIAFLAIALILNRFNRVCESHRKREILLLLSTARRAESEKRDIVSKLTDKKRSISTEWLAKEAALNAEIASIRQRLAEELKSIQHRVNARVVRLGLDRKAVLDNTQREVAALEVQANTKVAGLTQKRNLIATEEAAERARLLKKTQDDHIQKHLCWFSVRDAEIQGLGPKLKQALIDQGIRTAADVDSHRISRVAGIGDHRSRCLLDWRRARETAARRNMPTALVRDAELRLHSSFEARATALANEITEVQRRLNEDRISVQQRADQRIKTLDAESLACGQSVNDEQARARRASQVEEIKVRAMLSKASEEYARTARDIEVERLEASKVHYGVKLAMKRCEDDALFVKTITLTRYAKRICLFAPAQQGRQQSPNIVV